MKACRLQVLLNVVDPIIHTTFQKPLSPIIEREVKNTFSSKEVHSLYATEKPSPTENSQYIPKLKPRQKHGYQKPLTRVMRIYL